MRARDNPYRVEWLHALRFRLQGGCWDRLWERFVRQGRRGCVLGPHGSGKTTLLLELAEWLRDTGLSVRMETVRTGESRRHDPRLWCEGLGEGAVLVVDGADLLSPLRWRRLVQGKPRVAGLIVASHTRRLLPVLHSCRTTADLLDDLIRELHPGNGCGQPSAGDLFTRHRGDLREALRELYDFHAGIRGQSCRV